MVAPRRPLGDAVAMTRLGVLLRNRFDEDSVAEAEQWWRRAADLGDADAMVNLGNRLAELGRNKTRPTGQSATPPIWATPTPWSTSGTA